MRAVVWMTIAHSAAVVAHGQQLSVSICNLGGVHPSVVVISKAEAEAVFRAAHVQIVWVDCDEADGPDTRRIQTAFGIRLRTDITPRAVGTLSLEEMDRAFVSDDSSGYPNGIMRARWEGKEVSALRQRWFRFNSSQATSIRSFLARQDSSSTPDLRVTKPVPTR